MPLADRSGPDPKFPTAPNGKIQFSRTYDLSDSSVFDGGFSKKDLTPLSLREIVLHRGFLEPGIQETLAGGTEPVYSALIPVSSRKITPVPLPAAGWELLAGSER